MTGENSKGLVSSMQSSPQLSRRTPPAHWMEGVGEYTQFHVGIGWYGCAEIRELPEERREPNCWD